MKVLNYVKVDSPENREGGRETERERERGREREMTWTYRVTRPDMVITMISNGAKC